MPETSLPVLAPGGISSQGRNENSRVQQYGKNTDFFFPVQSTTQSENEI
jgi:hypothetical protein